MSRSPSDIELNSFLTKLGGGTSLGGELDSFLEQKSLDESNPFGVFSEPEALEPGSSFGTALIQQFPDASFFFAGRHMTPGQIAQAKLEASYARTEPVGEFAAGVTGEVIRTLPAMIAPHLGITRTIGGVHRGLGWARDFRSVWRFADSVRGAQVGFHLGRALGFAQERSDNFFTILGAATIEAGSEFLGLDYLSAISSSAARSIGRAVANRSFGEAAATITKLTAGAGVEGLEEVISLVGQELVFAASGSQTFDDALNNIKQQAAMTFLGGAAAGAVITGFGASAKLMMSGRGDNGFSGLPDNVVTPQDGSIADEARTGVAAPSLHENPMPVESVEAVAERLVQAASVVEEAAQEAAEQAVDVETKLFDTIESLGPESTIEQITSAEGQLEATIQAAEAAGIDTTDAKSALDELRQAKQDIESVRKVSKTKKADAASEQKKRVADAIRKAKQSAERAFKAGAAEAKARTASKFRQRIADLNEKTKARIAEIRSKAAGKRAAEVGIQREFINLVTEYANQAGRTPQERLAIRGKFIKRVGRTLTYNQLAKGIEALRIEVERVQTQQARADLLKTFDRVSKNVGKMRSPSLRAMVEEVLGMVQRSALSTEKRLNLEAVKLFVEANPDSGLIGQRGLKDLERLDKVPISEMSAADANQLNSILTALEARSKAYNTVVVLGRKADLEATAQTVFGEMSSSDRPLGKKRKVDGRGRLAKEGGGGLLKLVKLAVSPFQVAHAETLTEYVGSKVTHEVLYANIDRARDQQLKDEFEVLDEFNETLKALGVSDAKLSVWSDAYSVHSNLLARLAGTTDIGKTKAAPVAISLSSGTVELTAGEWGKVLTQMADPSIREKVMSGAMIRPESMPVDKRFALTHADIATIRAALPAEILAIVDKVIEINNGKLHDAVKRWMISERGEDNTVDHTYDPSRRVKPGAEIEAVDITAQNYESETLADLNILKDRTDDATSDFIIGDLFEDFYRHVRQVTSLVNIEPAVRNARKVLAHPDVAEFIRSSKDGHEFRQRIDSMYDAVMREGSASGVRVGIAESALGRAMALIGRGALGLNPRVMAYQYASMFAAATEIPERYLSRAMAAGAPFDSKLDEKIDKSPHLRSRRSGIGLGVAFEGARGDDIAYAGIRYVDHAAVRTIYRAAEMQAADEGLKGEAADKRAAEIASRTVKRTQPNNDPLHTSALAIAARENPALRLLSIFRTQRAQNINILMRSIVAYRHDSRLIGKLVADLLRVLVGQSLAIVGIKSMLATIGPKGREEAKDLSTYAKGLSDTMLGNFLFGDYASAMVTNIAGRALQAGGIENRLASGFEPSLTPLGSAMTSLFDAGRGVVTHGFEGKWDDKFWNSVLDFVQSIGLMTGQPFVAPVREVRRIADNFTKQTGTGLHGRPRTYR